MGTKNKHPEFWLCLDAKGYHYDVTILYIQEVINDPDDSHCRKLFSRLGINHKGEVFKKYPYDWIRFFYHGGFDTSGDDLKAKDDIETTLTKSATDESKAETEKFRQLGKKEYLKERNIIEYERLAGYWNNRVSEISTCEKGSPEWQPIEKELQKLFHWRGAFVEWFLEKGFPIPPLDFEDFVLSNSLRDNQGFSSQFPALPGLKWSEVTITFIKNDTIKVEARDIREIYLNENIGFIDKRIANEKEQSNYAWKWLMNLAKEGEIVLPDRAKDATKNSKLKKMFSNIRKLLKVFMQINDDPFFPYGKYQSYKPKFILRYNLPNDDTLYDDSSDRPDYYSMDDYNQDPRTDMRKRRLDILENESSTDEDSG